MSADLERWSNEEVALVDLLDRVIGGGVVITGEVVIGIAGVDLVYLGLQLVLAPAHEVEQHVALRRRSA
jgi:Gas vesicle protein